MKRSTMMQGLLLCWFSFSTLAAMQVVNKAASVNEHKLPQDVAREYLQEEIRGVDADTNTAVLLRLLNKHVPFSEIACSSTSRMTALLIGQLTVFMRPSSLARVLNEQNVNVDLIDDKGWSVLRHAYDLDDIDTIRTLILAGVTIRREEVPLLGGVLDDFVSLGNRHGVLRLLVGGADPNSHVATFTTCSTLCNAVFKVINGSSKLYNELTIVCMLLSAGASLSGLSWDVGLKNGGGRELVSCAMQDLVEEWVSANYAKRLTLITSVLRLVPIHRPVDSKAVHNQAKNIVMACRLLETERANKQEAIQRVTPVYSGTITLDVKESDAPKAA